MAKTNYAYDHPAYLVREQLNASLTGSGGAARFAAFTTLKLKSITIKPSTGGTSNDAGSAVIVDGTTTTTVATWTFGSGGTTGTSFAPTTAGSWGTNGWITVTKGTDATAVLQVAIEVQASAGSDMEA